MYILSESVDPPAAIQPTSAPNSRPQSSNHTPTCADSRHPSDPRCLYLDANGQAKKEFERNEAKKEAVRLRKLRTGEDTWTAPGLDRRLGGGKPEDESSKRKRHKEKKSKHKHKSKKEKKEKKEKKHKSHKVGPPCSSPSSCPPLLPPVRAVCFNVAVWRARYAPS